MSKGRQELNEFGNANPELAMTAIDWYLKGRYSMYSVADWYERFAEEDWVRERVSERELRKLAQEHYDYWREA